MQFSLSFFSSTGAESADSKYALLIESAKYADQRGFTAVWTPERHFHAFGGIFPNPALTGVLLALETSRIRIRAGSVVLPLHHVVRVAEDWSVVDNLSHGRVDLSFAVGWHQDNFVLAPDNYSRRVDLTFDRIETLRRLWRGEAYTGPNGLGQTTSVHVHPSPVQADLSVWVTCSKTRERFVQAGQKDFNVLTALIFQTMPQLAERIRDYRAARVECGLRPEDGTVTVMLHTFVGASTAGVRDIVRDPLTSYLRSSVDLWQKQDNRLQKLTQRDDGLAFAVDRYFRQGGLFGSVDTCAERVEELREIGVDEIACLIDYGVDAPLILDGLEHLSELKQRFENPIAI